MKSPLVEVLKKEFEMKKARNSAYSLRAFSKYLDMDASNLSKIMNYKLVPGAKLKQKISNKLGLESYSFSSESQISINVQDKDYQEHAMDSFNLLSDWYHYAILEYVKLDVYKSNSSDTFIGKALDLSKLDLKLAIDRLIRMDYLSRDPKTGRLINTEDSSSSILKVNTSKAHKNHQKQILEMAIDALDETPEEQRSQSSMTIAIDKNKLKEAKLMIKDFRRQLARYLSESGELNDVYHLSLSLYPLTKDLNKGEE